MAGVTPHSPGRSMTIASMTGFARQNGHAAPFRWSWEVKTVNSKGLDLRLRLPPGFDALDIPARAAIAKVVTRGACQANLTILRESLAAAPRINHALLAQLLEIVSAAPLPKNVGPATLDGLLALRGRDRDRRGRGRIRARGRAGRHAARAGNGAGRSPVHARRRGRRAGKDFYHATRRDRKAHPRRRRLSRPQSRRPCAKNCARRCGN